ncbi:EF-hand domain-containing protein [Hydrogenophaga sp. D2P1]|uniref:EF-hand domain-containing protein n=1 Tax=Hydrogenophaga aromaticivorans TaxID=2610898 RepID=A0A7Y8KY71_9BURK|nr:EF-hand domain-containing protein [Hydrogenophaga aromaticivorans]NWF45823.1 EF-hand domain-containing protein [Hydrogenophaga aromaticivorans]
MKLSYMASLAALFIALPAAAQPSTRPMGPGPMPVFADFDGNGDGRITEQEFIDARSKRIAERASEGRAMRGLSQALDFKEIDTHGDGGLSREEFDANQMRHFQNRPMPPAR